MDKTELLEQIKNAMKAKDKNRLSILRQVNQSLKQIEVDERREVTEADIVAAVKRLQKVTREEQEALQKAAGSDHADRIAMLEEQSCVLTSLLPAQLEGDELEAAIDALIAEQHLQSRRDIGKLMGALTAQTNGNFDKRAAAAMAGAKLG